MIFFTKKYYRETTLLIILCAIVALLLYYFLLNNTLSLYTETKENRAFILKQLSDDLVLQKKDIAVQKQLQSINEKNALLYTKAKTLRSADQLSAKLSGLVEQSGFSLQSIQPLSTNHELHFTVTAQGNYFALYRLVQAIKENAWPITIVVIQIDKNNTYHLDFSTAGIL